MIHFLLLFLIFFGGNLADHRLVKTKVAEGIIVSISKALSPMTVEDMAQRFPSVRKPIGAFTDVDRRVDFSINLSATQWPDRNLEIARGFFKSGISNLYDRVEWMKEGVREVHKKKYIYFEFESRSYGGRRQDGGQDLSLKYTYIMYLIENKRTLVITFSCPKELREEWQETAHKMMDSVRIR